MPLVQLRIVGCALVLCLLSLSRARAEEANTQYDAVLAMRPVGYWPLNEGQAETIHDRSINGNHGRIHHVAWDTERNLLDFVGRYQWLQIPKHAAYQSPAFSMGGWVFTRTEVIGSAWVNRQGMLLFGNRAKWGQSGGVQLCIRKQEMIDVLSGGREDVLGTRLYASYRDGARVERAYGTPSLPLRQWQHLLYTFEAGTGAVYLNGKLIASTNEITYQAVNADLRIGNDAAWWHQQAGRSGSLDGSVRNMVWFDRALSPAEVLKLHSITTPTEQPWISDDTMVVLDGRGIAVGDLPELAPESLRRALELYSEKPEDTLSALSAALLPVLKKAILRPACRLPATQLLLKMDGDASRAALRDAQAGLLGVVQSEHAPQNERAEAALALAAMKQDAAATVPALAETLTAILDRDGARLPRVEDLLRNALIRALWDIAPSDALTRQLIGRAFASPLLNAADLSTPEFETVRAQMAQDDPMAALETFARLPLNELGTRFFTFKERGARGDYTASARHKGSTYTVGEGIAWKGVEKVSPAAFEAIVSRLSTTHPQAKIWRASNFEHLYRVPVRKISPDGREQLVYLEGEDFVLDGHDAKCRAWSIFVDALGYIHLMGGQHNTPNPDHYIPGSWEKIGIGRDRRGTNFPKQMYWVSTQPESIDAFEFVGQRHSPRAIPANYLNYMNLLQGPKNETFLYGRVDAYGWQSWGMFRYSAAEQRWSHVGGDPYDLIESARRRDPKWMHHLHDNMRGAYPKKPGETRCLVWAWQPPFYNFCRDRWGARFDQTGRLHVRMQISGLDAHAYNRLTSVYAWSDDQGQTFHRADGSAVQLPLSINPAPEHNAEIGAAATAQWWNLWAGLLRQAGYRSASSL